MTKEELMHRAIELSKNSVKTGGGPFGAVIAKDGIIIAEASNSVTCLLYTSYSGVLQHNFKLSNDRVNIRLLYSKYQPQDGLMVVAYYRCV